MNNQAWKNILLYYLNTNASYTQQMDRNIFKFMIHSADSYDKSWHVSKCNDI